jgi:GR25 family glycosyltransferase involved in LPS biosynthesis
MDFTSEIYKSFATDIANENCQFYCLCYKNETKHKSMKNRFSSLGLNLIIYDGVPHTDPRIIKTPQRDIDQTLQRLWSVTYGHLDMIQLFYNSGKPFGLFCEDDIVVNRTLPLHLPQIISECTELNIECLLLGYMKTYKVEGWMQGHELIYSPSEGHYTYHEYPQDQWGVHLYMLSRIGAKKILDYYAAPSGYADQNLHDPDRSFSPDWTITKCPNMRRALISPMLACEDGGDPYEHYSHLGQYNFHMETFRFNFIPGLFI